MYNGHEYLSCIKIPAAKQAMTKNALNAHKPDKPENAEKAEPMDFAADRRDLIAAANKVFGEGKWNHTVVSQTLDFVDTIGAADKTDAGDKCRAGCVSFVKVQLENGNYHEDVGYYIAEESTKGLSIQNARIGSAVNALKTVLLSFGEKIERDLQQLRRHINPEQTNDLQKDVALDKQISKKSKVSFNTYVSTLERQDFNAFCEPLEATVSKPFGAKTKTERSSVSEPEANKNSTTDTNPSSSVKIQSVEVVDLERRPSLSKTNSTSEQKSKPDPLVFTVNNGTTVTPLVFTGNNGTTETNPSSCVKIQSVEFPLLSKTNSTSEQKSKPDLHPTRVSIVPRYGTALMCELLPNKTNSTSEQKSKPALSRDEMLRMERKRKQMEKQMEFKKRMMEKGELMPTSDNKPNPSEDCRQKVEIKKVGNSLRAIFHF